MIADPTFLVDPLLGLFLAMAISVVVIPVCHRMAPWLGLIDRPGERKVHAAPIARVGGWGIFAGALVPIVLWVPLEPVVLAFVFGSSVLFVFGAIDDRFELGHYWKFLGQFIAVVPLVFWADFYVQRVPFVDEPLSFVVGGTFTVFALVGMINAINHSDGLDGLAGGESLLSLIAMGLLVYLYTPFGEMSGVYK